MIHLYLNRLENKQINCEEHLITLMVSPLLQSHNEG